jgi:hypothetical protein
LLRFDNDVGARNREVEKIQAENAAEENEFKLWMETTVKDQIKA